MNDTPTGLSRYAALAVRLSAAWLLTGALFKLFAGSPKLLPALVLDHSPFDWMLTFHVVIAIELVIVSFALLKPHLAWPAISALFTFFLVVLTSQQMKGVESCGCLGDTIKIPPLLMMAVDGTLLLFMLATRPWKALAGPGLSPALLAGAILVSISAPWVVIRTTIDQPVPAPGIAATTGGEPVKTARYLELTPLRWVGRSIFDVDEFTKWVPIDKIPTDGRIVLWRQGCAHCAKHLRDLANEKDESQAILLVQVMDDLKTSREVDAMPTGSNVTQLAFPDGLEGMLTTPVEIRIEGGIVKAALYEEDMEKLKSKSE